MAVEVKEEAVPVVEKANCAHSVSHPLRVLVALAVAVAALAAALAVTAVSALAAAAAVVVVDSLNHSIRFFLTLKEQLDS
jgi:hypothetical protein